jgi:hypothetical protein
VGRVMVPAVVWLPGGIGEDIWCPTAAGMKYAVRCGVVEGTAASTWSRWENTQGRQPRRRGT